MPRALIRPERTTTARRGPTIALALGGGGARGPAHILRLEAFDELGLSPKVIAGTSIGAIFGAASAAAVKPSPLATTSPSSHRNIWAQRCRQT